MSDSRLPDDLARWPDDPFQLLGVRPGVAPRDLRRAYTELIRRFKPEHFPEHFRRIREAFETVQRFATFFSPDRPADPPADAPSPPADTPPDQPEPAPAPDPWPVPDVRVDGPDELWAKAVAGDPGAAYRGLRELADRTPGRPDLYARLYWLAVLYPDLDPGRAPADWLAKGMVETGPGGPLLALYASEVQYETGEAGAPRWDAVLRADHPPAGLAGFLRARWQVLCRLGRWAAVRDDLAVVRDRVRVRDEAAWLGLLAELLNWLDWSGTGGDLADLETFVRDEAGELSALSLRYAALFDQMEWRDAVARSWRCFRRVGPWAADFLGVLQDGWRLPAERLRGWLEVVLGQMSRDPVAWVELFDRAGPEGQAALTHFGNLLSAYRAGAGIEDACPHAPSQLRDLAAAALGWPGQDEELLRGRALRFCLAEATGPDQVRTAFDPALGGPPGVPDWVLRLSEDPSLHYVCWACRLFRS